MLGVISIENAIASSHVNSASSASTDAQSVVLGIFRDTPGRSGHTTLFIKRFAEIRFQDEDAIVGEVARLARV